MLPLLGVCQSLRHAMGLLVWVLWVGRLVNLPSFVISFQLLIVPLDSFNARPPMVLATFTAYSQYYWLSVLLWNNSVVSISSRHLLSAGKFPSPIFSCCSISFVISCFVSSLIIPFV